MRVSRIPKKRILEVTTDDGINISLLEPVIKKYKNKKGNLIPLLQAAQNLYGYIPPQAFEKISRETGLKISDMYGVATFYAQFRLKPVGKHIIRVCHGTACHVQGASNITEELMSFLEVKDGETTNDRLFTLESVACLGCCSLAPVMMIGDETYGKLNKKKAVDVIKDLRRKESLKQKTKLIENTSKN
ncbi:MAG: NADH-quinone oxidoreductase subunit NuoE [Ignavibacteria bacterium]